MPRIKDRCYLNVTRVFDKLSEKVHEFIAPLELEAYVTPEPVTYDKRTEGQHVKLEEGVKWGAIWDCAWFHVTGTVPQSAAGKQVVLYIDVDGECLIFDDEGNAVQGLTSVEKNYDGALGLSAPKRIVWYLPEAKGGEKVDFWMDVGRNYLLGNNSNMTLTEHIDGYVQKAQIAIRHEERWQLHTDFFILMNLLTCLDVEGAQYSSVLFSMHDAASLLKTFSDEEVAKAREILARELSKTGGTPSLNLTTLGHSHIDLAWLWPIRETKRKGGRTFANALKLMERYDDYIFGASQPQLYQWVKEDYPDLYAKVKERVKEGRWELQGGMWVEPDTNVPSGESLVRQFIYGKRYFMEEFGQEIRNLWMPDVFGYSAALPQIMKKSGVDYFMTAKLAANDMNRFPNHTFMWEGIDGTQVMSHMIAEGSYNGPMYPRSLKITERVYSEKGVCDEALLFFGVGDGGGGPGEEHLENFNRIKNLQGLCPVKQGFAQDAFERMAKQMDRFDVYRGELYFERHQGTYTTQCLNKWYNRRIEYLFHEVECLLTMTNPAKYPKDELDEMWKEFLLYQFHDILPGSSINRVYEESVEGYSKIAGRLTAMIDDICATLAGDKVAVNTLSWDRWDWVVVDGKPVKVRTAALSAAPVEVMTANVSDLKADGLVIENANLRVTFNTDGSLASVYDKVAGRESLREGTAGNRLMVWDDLGDCWDIPREYRYLEPECFTLREQSAGVDGCMAFMKQVYVYGESTVTQIVCLEEGRAYVDFRTEVEWLEDCKMLRAMFDVDIVADAAAYEIQFGFLRRANNDNNPYEVAKFEACAHKWADLSQSNYGVALMNDCKYGYRVKGTEMDITLLRAQNFPGIGSDRGHHEFRYALYPHTGSTGDSDVVRQGHEYNLPITVKNAGGTLDGQSLFSVDGGVILDTVKRAEDGDGVVLRFYEPSGRCGKAVVACARDYAKAAACDLLEREEGNVALKDGKFSFDFKPFEIITIKLK